MESAEAQITTATLGIKGMTCATCASAIEKLLSPMEGINNVAVSLLMNEAVIEFDPRKIPMEEIIEEIEDIGFDANLTATTVKHKQDQNECESIVKSLKMDKRNIVIWSAKIDESIIKMDSNYFYRITKHLVGIQRIVFNDQCDILSIYFDVLSILPMAITHSLQTEGLLLREIILSHAFPELHKKVKKGKALSELKQITFSIADPLNKYNLFNERNALDFNSISREFGEIIESVNTKKVTKTDKKTKIQTNRLHVLIEYYDIACDDASIAMIRSTAREISRFLVDTLEISPNDLLIIDAMSAERDLFRATQLAIVTKIQKQFYMSCLFSIPIFFIAMVFPYIPIVKKLLHQHPISGNKSVDVSGLLLFVLSIPVQFYVARTFYISCFAACKHKTSNMSTLIALGTLIAWIYSFIALLLGFFATHQNSLNGGTHFFETSTTVITIVLLGKWLQAKAKFKTCDAIGMLMDLTSPFAVLVNTNEYGEIVAFEPDQHEEKEDDHEMEREVSTELVVRGDVIKIHRGARVPVDGTIVYGSSSMDERMITGESFPRNATIGDSVISSSINCGNCMILIRVNKSKSDSVISKIIQLMKSSQTNKPTQQAFADTVSSYFVPIVVSIAVVTFVIWYSLCSSGSLPAHYNTGDCGFFSILFSMAVMVIACPCALGLATPTAVMVGMGVAAKYGCLIKGGDVLEVAHHLDIIVFDKTGTLTYGKPKVVAFVMFDDDTSTLTKSDAIYFAGCSELNSEHPLGKAIAVYAQEQLHESGGNKELITPTEFESVPGKGIKSNIDGHVIHIGNAAWFFGDDNENKLNIKFAPNANVSSIGEIKRILRRRNNAGNISLLLAIDYILTSYICLFDAPRPETKDVIQLLQTKYNKKCVMLTGDNHNTAIAVAKSIGIEEANVISRVLPQDKHRVIKQLQTDTLHSIDTNNEVNIEMTEKKDSEKSEKQLQLDYKCKVAMVGDGINDAAALTQADLGIAIGNGTDIAIEAADVILMNDNLWNIGMLIDLSTTIIHRIYWNFVWALGFNCLGIPIAAGVFYPLFQVRLPPQLAAVAMALSSLCVVISSMLLKTYTSPYSKKNAFKMEMKADAVKKMSMANQKACGCGLKCGCKENNILNTKLLEGGAQYQVTNMENIFESNGNETIQLKRSHTDDCYCDECGCDDHDHDGEDAAALSSDNCNTQ